MHEAIVITPVKNSIETTLETIACISQADGNFRHMIYNDFSNIETKETLEAKRKEFGYDLIHLEDITDTPSPNYKLVLQKAQEDAVANNLPLIIVESDVLVKTNTLSKMLSAANYLKKCGMLGAITVDESGKINFPYLNFKHEKKKVVNTNHSLSFCCTLLTPDLLKSFSFKELSSEKDWFDVFISRKSKTFGFSNYLLTDLPVIHKPHSSRPWKQLKYSNPIKYYYQKIVKRKDRI